MKHATEWKRKLAELATGKVLFDECMDRHTSIGVGGPADALAFPESAAEMGRIVAFLRAEGIAAFFMGNGTNLIVRDDGFRGVIVSTKALRSIRIEERGGGRAAIRGGRIAGRGGGPRRGRDSRASSSAPASPAASAAGSA
jgi:UDP-N-acetylmuramate dehydrogenase